MDHQSISDALVFNFAHRKIFVNIRFIFITIALLCILALMWLILPMLEQKAMKDPYSAACPAGRYSVEEECVPLTSCKNDGDCWYLEKGTLPPRSGR
ncbi:MAG: hypothetical protein L0Y56_10815, partial [Nitrospira sp.]|nr:hypothetical protein [Nitrospira sp.]